MEIDRLIIGTRSSELALWQANYVKSEIHAKFPDIKIELKRVQTKGDKILDVALSKIGDKGLFTKELENELLNGEIDLAAHSLKDIQTELPKGLTITAITKRHNPQDVLIAREKGAALISLPENGTLATGSLRRRAQVLARRPDISIVDLRGNINTRIKKFLNSEWDAIILARAGVERIGLERYVSSILDFEEMLPAVGQGAIGIEIAEEREDLKKILSEINHSETETATFAERAFLKALGGGCQTPIAAHAHIVRNKVEIDGLITSLDGKDYFRAKINGSLENSKEIGKRLAEKLLSEGADRILKDIKS